MPRSELPGGTVTFLFTDVQDSTKLLHAEGERGYAAALSEHRRLLRAAFERHGGVEVDTQGDAFFIAFPTAPGALAAALESQEALEAGPIRVRMGLHTGTPYLGDEGYIGSVVHLGARIAASGHGGQILVSSTTRELVTAELEDLGEHRFKDFAEPVWIYQVGGERFPPLRTISNTNLPRPASSFVGRDREQAEIVALVRAGTRLVTLCGPGGAGKTRLAIEAAAELVPDFRNGVYWVSLAAVRDPALVVETIGQLLGSEGDVTAQMADRQLLLLLDNFEQVVDAAVDVSDLLAACPGVCVLVTSRELLRIDGERTYPVPPLRDSEAVELFCQRSGLQPDDRVAELCARLDNLPLAVELAAARTSLLGPAQILERLGERLDVLKGRRDLDPRQQTLRATIAWSHDLLDDLERHLFAALAVFRGGCTLRAAEEVLSADVDALQSLVDKSLLRRTGERLWMLETIREYALERLAESGAEAELRQRHAAHFLRLAEEARLDDDDIDLAETLDLVAAEYDNLRRALECARDGGDGEMLLRLAAALAEYWRIRGVAWEAREWLGLALQHEAPREARLRVLRAAVVRAIEDRDLAGAAALLEECRAAAEQSGERIDVLRVLSLSSHLAHAAGDLDATREAIAESKELAAELGERDVVAATTVNLAVLAFETRDYRAGLEQSLEAFELFSELEQETGMAVALLSCGWNLLCLGDLAAAEESFVRGLGFAVQVGAVPRITNGAEGLGATLVAASEPERGVEFLGAASSLRKAMGIGLEDDLEEELHAEAVERARTALGEAVFASAWARGEAMTAAEVADRALKGRRERA